MCNCTHTLKFYTNVQFYTQFVISHNVCYRTQHISCDLDTMCNLTHNTNFSFAISHKINIFYFYCSQGPRVHSNLILIGTFVARQFLSQIYALLSVKFSGLKMCEWIKMTNIRYDSLRMSHIQPTRREC